MADLLMKMPIPYEPKRMNRFILSFPSELGINEWYVESTSRPAITIKSVDIPFLNTKKYVAGQYEWGEISVTFRESVTGRMGYAAGYKKDVTLQMLDPTGVVVEKWVLIGCFLTKADFQGLDYGNDGLAKIQASLRPDYCVLVY
jgi:hypothetical protein